MKKTTRKRSRKQVVLSCETEPTQLITTKRFTQLFAVETTANKLAFLLDAYFGGKNAGDFRLLYKVTNARRDLMDELRGVPCLSTATYSACTGISYDDPAL